ncbi:CAP domain-containing protein [Kribbella sp. NBC_01245]|uniref:CAP domain-containing protein n=1 Tax=Kribbella sp. NBC_01245 TaxID=2903578 RepID=UPI002E2E040E|nr:CAP domain-containing protein [Kribbella sp. NBC_01245]
MTDSPASGRHRRKARRGVLGPVVSALSVLLATAPVVWVMTSSRGDSVQDRQATLQNVSDDDLGTERGSDAIDNTGEKRAGVVVTLPHGKVVTTTPGGTSSLGPLVTGTTGTPKPGQTTVPTKPTPTAGTTTAPPTTTITVRPTRTPTDEPTRTGQSTKPTRTPTSTPTRTVTATPTKTPTTPPPSQPPPNGTNSVEREVLDLVNAERRDEGCRPLQLNDALVRAAGGHASDMANRKYFSHETPEGKTASRRMRDAGWSGRTYGENIAAGYPSAESVVDAWMESDGHRANILNCSFTVTGIGYDPGRVKEGYSPGSWVQDFGG